MSTSIPYCQIKVKCFTVTQESSGNLWADLAAQADQWLQDVETANEPILLRDVHVSRPESVSSGLEAAVLTLIYEVFASDDDPDLLGPGYGHPYRVLYLDSLEGSGYASYNEWFEDQDIANGLDDTARIAFMVPVPVLRRGDIEKGPQFFAIYKLDDTIDSGPNSERVTSRPLACGRGDYLIPFLVEATQTMDPFNFVSGAIIYATDGTTIASDQRMKVGTGNNESINPGEVTWGLTDQFSFPGRMVLTSPSECAP